MELYPTASYNLFNRVKLHFSLSAKEKCKEIHKSCVGPGTNEKALIQILGSQPPNERNLIALRYRKKYDQNLADLVEKAICDPEPRLRYMAGESAHVFFKGRALMSDEEWVTMGRHLTAQDFFQEWSLRFPMSK